MDSHSFSVINNGKVGSCASRPYFKGVMHLFTLICYIITMPYLILQIPSKLFLPLSLYLASIVAHFSASSLLHLVDWNHKTINKIRCLDHVVIHLKIFTTYNAVMTTVLPHFNPYAKVFLIIGTIIGIIMRIFFTDLPVKYIAAPGLLVGWSVLLDPYLIFLSFRRIPAASTVALLGGLSYTIGAIVYMMKRPNPWPKYFGYHEVFHVFSTLGSVLFTIFIFKYAIPEYKLN